MLIKTVIGVFVFACGVLASQRINVYDLIKGGQTVEEIKAAIINNGDDKEKQEYMSALSFEAHCAMSHGRLDVIAMLLDDLNLDPRLYAAFGGDWSLPYRLTHFALKYGHFDVFDMFVDSMVKRNIKFYDDIVLDAIYYKVNIETISKILNGNRNLEMTNKEGKTLSELVHETGDSELIQVFEDSNRNIAAQYEASETA